MTKYYQELLKHPNMAGYSKMKLVQNTILKKDNMILLQPEIVQFGGGRALAQVAEVYNTQGREPSYRLLTKDRFDKTWVDIFYFTNIRYMPLADNFPSCNGGDYMTNTLKKDKYIVSQMVKDIIYGIKSENGNSYDLFDIIYLKEDTKWRVFTYQLSKIIDDGDKFKLFFTKLKKSTAIKANEDRIWNKNRK